MAEVLHALGGLPVQVDLLPDHPRIPEPEETGLTFRENALLKSRYYSRLTGEPTLSEDSGLAVEVLDGCPGVRSARLAPTDGERIRTLLKLIADADPGWPDSRPRARFVSAMCLSLPNERIQVQGEVWGRIVPEARGANGFGYDPVFFYPPLNKTFAQLTIEQKSRISHRVRALRKLRARLDRF